MTILAALLQGLPLTLLLWFAAQIVGAVIAVPVAAGRTRHAKGLRLLCACWIGLFRGIPTLVWLFVIFFGLASAGVNLTSVFASIVALGLISSAYIAEIYRSGFDAVPKAQFEAVRALGLPLRARLVHVILPQAAPVIAEGLTSYSVHLLKETALASLIGVVEIMAIANYRVERSGNGLVVFFLTGLIYMAGSLALVGVANRLLRRFNSRAGAIGQR